MKQESMQVNTPPPHTIHGILEECPVPTGFMQIRYTGIEELEDGKKVTKKENVSKAVPTGIKRERE